MEGSVAYGIKKDIVLLFSQNFEESCSVLTLVATEATNKVLHVHVASKSSLEVGLAFSNRFLYILRNRLTPFNITV